MDIPIYNPYKFIYILGVFGIVSAICLTVYTIYYLLPNLPTYYWFICSASVFGFDILPLELIAFVVKRLVRKSNLLFLKSRKIKRKRFFQRV